MGYVDDIIGDVIGVPDEIKHHGVKGMKWGVRRSPEQLGLQSQDGGGGGAAEEELDPEELLALMESLTDEEKAQVNWLMSSGKGFSLPGDIYKIREGKYKKQFEKDSAVDTPKKHLDSFWNDAGKMLRGASASAEKVLKDTGNKVDSFITKVKANVRNTTVLTTATSTRSSKSETVSTGAGKKLGPEVKSATGADGTKYRTTNETVKTVSVETGWNILGEKTYVQKTQVVSINGKTRGGSTREEIKHENPNDESLTHAGVKGMKWGVRKDDSGRVSVVSGSDATSGIVADVSRSVHAQARKKAESMIKGLNKDPLYAGKNLNAPENKKLREQYDVDVAATVIHAYNVAPALAKQKRHQIYNVARITASAIIITAVAASTIIHEGSVEYSIAIERDPNGLIIGLGEPVENSLTHAGVKGMRWGFRKATTRGSTPPSNRKAGDKTKETDEKPKKKTVKDLSDTELRDKINRLQMEKQYTQLSTPQKAENAVSSVLKQSAKAIAGQVITQVGTAYISKAVGVNLNKALPEAYRVTGKKG